MSGVSFPRVARQGTAGQRFSASVMRSTEAAVREWGGTGKGVLPAPSVREGETHSGLPRTFSILALNVPGVTLIILSVRCRKSMKFGTRQFQV